eukprot:352917-Chlamydomonas_euryale.AAC.1
MSGTGMVSPVSNSVSGELFEHADHGICWIMASVVGDDACCTIGCTKEKGCTVRAYLWSPGYCTYEYAVCRVQYVLYAQVKRCGCRRWCCGFHNTAVAPHGVDFTQWIGRLRNNYIYYIILTAEAHDTPARPPPSGALRAATSRDEPQRDCGAAGH